MGKKSDELRTLKTHIDRLVAMELNARDRLDERRRLGLPTAPLQRRVNRLEQLRMRTEKRRRKLEGGGSYY